jgi:glycerate dehydrogenase
MIVRIVVLDGHTLNPGDLSWDALKALGSCDVYDRTGPAQVVERAAGAEIALTNKTVLSRMAITQLPQLRYIGVLATGYNVVDVEAARQRGICVTNVPAYGTPSVAQMVFAHLLHFTQHVSEHSRSVHDGDWSRSPDFCYWNYPLVELAGLTMGIVGLGRIGRQTAQLALAFGMKVIYFDVTPAGSVPARASGTCVEGVGKPGNATLPRGVEKRAKQELGVPGPFPLSNRGPEVRDKTPYGVTTNVPEEVVAVDLDTLFRDSDVVSLHCPLTQDNRGFVNRQRLEMMKPTAFLINTSRGPLIDEPALAEALNRGRIAGAGLDVLCEEPPRPDNPLLHAPNCTITPHIAWATQAARQRLMDIAASNVRAFLQGRPQNVV